MSFDHHDADVLRDYDADLRFDQRLAALATYRELRGRRWRGQMAPGDRDRLAAARDILENSGGLPALWFDTREP